MTRADVVALVLAVLVLVALLATSPPSRPVAACPPPRTVACIEAHR